jgi:hypothetical protein
MPRIAAAALQLLVDPQRVGDRNQQGGTTAKSRK